MPQISPYLGDVPKSLRAQAHLAKLNKTGRNTDIVSEKEYNFLPKHADIWTGLYDEFRRQVNCILFTLLIYIVKNFLYLCYIVKKKIPPSDLKLTSCEIDAQFM